LPLGLSILNGMKILIKISITNDKNIPFMGIGLVWLMQGIKKYKSINRAAKDMNLSYAKAIKMINLLEKNLSCEVVIRRHGGNDRIGAELTSFGEEYIKKYDKFQKKIKEYAEKEFQKFIKQNKENYK
jgi:molybdate transport system regulatory protein